jgi:transcriptional regulator with XRE-family HTH domain
LDRLFGDIIEDRLNEVGMTQAQLSKLVGCSPSTITRIIQNSTRIDINYLINIVQVLYGITDFEEILKSPEVPTLPENYRKVYIESEQSLIRLSIIVGVPTDINQNWQVSLAAWLGVEPTDIYGWIKNNHIPAEIVKNVEDRGYQATRWLTMGKRPTIGECFKKLAAIAGVTDPYKWGEKLAKKLNIPSNTITKAIRSRILDQETITKIEDAGYPPDMWLPKDSYKSHQLRKLDSLTKEIEKIKKGT